MRIDILEIRYEFNNKEETIYPVVLDNGKDKLLVDCGYPGFMPLLANAMAEKGIAFNDLTGIIITHHDMDHMGSLYEIKQTYPFLKVYSSEIEEKFISGKSKSLRLQQAEDLFNTLPAEQKPGAVAFQNLLKEVRPVSVNYTFKEDDNSMKGIEIISTPGHMPGHISLYIPALQTLIAADAVIYENEKLGIANPSFTLDLQAAVDSVKKLNNLSIERLICYHGGEINSNISVLIQTLLQEYDAF